jgi:serine/threonine protein kinase
MLKQNKRISHYVLKQEIGSGGFGKVYLGKDLNTGQRVAIKMIPNSLIVSSKREIEIMRSLKHENIVELYDDVKTTDQTYLFLEYCQGGDLKDLIEASQGLSETKARFFLKQIVEALKYLKTVRIIHRDLKPANILLDSEHNVKIADFGLARILDPDSLAKTILGTLLYMAPELMKKKELQDSIEKYGIKADIWSVGCIVYELIKGQRLFRDCTQSELKGRIQETIEKKTFLEPQVFSEVCMDFLVKVIAYEDKRMNFDEFCRHPFVTGLPGISRTLLFRGEVDYRNEISQQIKENQRIVVDYSNAVSFLRDEGLDVNFLLSLKACQMLSSIPMNKSTAGLFAEHFVFIDPNTNFELVSTKKIAQEIINAALEVYENYAGHWNRKALFKAALALIAVLKDNYLIMKLADAFRSCIDE